MKKYIVLSISENEDYIYFLPLTVWTWKQFGWEPIVLYHTTNSDQYKAMRQLTDEVEQSEINKRFPLSSIEGIQGATIAQVSRLYATASLRVDHGPFMQTTDYVMLGDVDMLALSDYWKPDYSNVTVWNWDLTGFGEIPMCYVGAPAKIWKEIMAIKPEDTVNSLISRDLSNYPNAKDEDFYKRWGCDQQILTARLNEYGKEKITFINRGQGTHGYARGRVDRGSGGWVLNQPELIDAHLRQQTHHKKDRVLELLALLKHVWPNENFDWFMEYSIRFRELTGHKN